MSGNYPSDVLPAPSQSGYSFTVEPIVMRERMDSGRYRQVARDVTQYVFANLSWDLTDSQLEIWRGFYNAVTGFGAYPFQINLSFGGGMVGCSAKFIPGYSVSSVGSFEWRVSAKVCLESIPSIDNSTDLETAGDLIGLVGTDWLTALPNVQDGFSFEVESSTQRTRAETSRYQNRNRTKRNVHVASVDWILSDAELEFFIGWHRVILGYGTRKFDMDLAFSDGYQSNTARIVDGVFTASLISFNNWRVSARVECDQATGEIRTQSDYFSVIGAGSNSSALHNGIFESEDFVMNGGGSEELAGGTFETGLT